MVPERKDTCCRILWLSEWITDPQMRGWVLNFWEKAMTIVPEITSVDDVPPLSEVIRLVLS